MAEQAPLSGRTVLVTRAPDDADAWIRALERLGAQVVPREVFRVVPPADPTPVLEAIDHLGIYDWVLLTSRNGLRFFETAVRLRSIGLASVSARFGVVGPQTAQALELLGVVPDVVARPANAAGLAQEMCRRLGPADRVLVVRPEKSRPELVRGLQRSGARIDAITFYRNQPAPSLREVARELELKCFDAVMFSAPSAVEHLHAVCAPACFSGVAQIAIGPSTEQALLERGVEVAAVALRPTPEGVAQAVVGALGR